MDSSNSSIYAGGIAFLLDNLAVYLPYTILYSIAAVCGVFGTTFDKISTKKSF